VDDAGCAMAQARSILICSAMPLIDSLSPQEAHSRLSFGGFAPEAEIQAEATANTQHPTRTRQLGGPFAPTTGYPSSA
jgi:hypothetical protein